MKLQECGLSIFSKFVYSNLSYLEKKEINY